MNSTSLLLSALLIAGFPRPALPDDEPAKGPAELQGCWKLKSVETGGESRDPLGGGEPRWVVKGDVIAYGGTELGKLTTDPTTSPKVIDLKFKEPERKYEGVYSIEKDVLTICVNRRDGATDRPGKLSTKDQPDWLLLVFEKEKAAPAKPLEGLTGFVGVQAGLGRGRRGPGERADQGQPGREGGDQEGRRDPEGGPRSGPPTWKQR